jgi:hypothetical protein
MRVGCMPLLDSAAFSPTRATRAAHDDTHATLRLTPHAPHPDTPRHILPRLNHTPPAARRSDNINRVIPLHIQESNAAHHAPPCTRLMRAALWAVACMRLLDSAIFRPSLAVRLAAVTFSPRHAFRHWLVSISRHA